MNPVPALEACETCAHRHFNQGGCDPLVAVSDCAACFEYHEANHDHAFGGTA